MAGTAYLYTPLLKLAALWSATAHNSFIRLISSLRWAAQCHTDHWHCRLHCQWSSRLRLVRMANVLLRWVFWLSDEGHSATLTTRVMISRTQLRPLLGQRYHHPSGQCCWAPFIRHALVSPPL